MKILVTGGAGFIGSHIVKQLLDSNNEVIIYDDFSTSQRVEVTSSERRETIVEGNIKDSKLLIESLQGVDAVIHMASFISVEESVKNPLKYMENNVLGTASLLTAMREAGVKKIVFSSSATVYGQPKSLPVMENAPLSAANPYAASKIAMEALCESFYMTDGFDVTILRYFNPYGPGENHQPETHAIPNFIKAGLRQGRSSFFVNRSSQKTKDNNEQRITNEHSSLSGNESRIPLYWKGEQVRDFIYVEDLAEAHIKVLEVPRVSQVPHVPRGEETEEEKALDTRGTLGTRGTFIQGQYRVFNVGTENGTKIIDVINILSEILGYSLDIEDLGERSGDVMANYASSKKLKEATGWEAKVSLEEGLRKTVEWFRGRI